MRGPPLLDLYMIVSTALVHLNLLSEAKKYRKCPSHYGFHGYERFEAKSQQTVDCVSYASRTFDKKNGETWISHFEKECAKQFHKGRLYHWPIYASGEAHTHHLLSYTGKISHPAGRSILNGLWISAISKNTLQATEQLAFTLHFGQQTSTDVLKPEQCNYMLNGLEWISEQGNSALCPQHTPFLDVISRTSMKEMCFLLSEKESRKEEIMEGLVTECDASISNFTAMCNHPFIPCEEDDSDGCKKCESPWDGRFCQIDLRNPCGQFPCGNNGECANRDGKARCKCRRGRTAVDPCESNPCQNNGRCATANGGYVCTCLKDLTGKHCETVIDPCKNVSCGSGKCQLDNGKPKCNCPAEFTGSNCEIAYDPCNPNPCKNNATCQKHYQSYRCICPEGFGGSLCSEAAKKESNPKESEEDSASQKVKKWLLASAGAMLLLTVILLACNVAYRRYKKGKKDLDSHTGTSWHPTRSNTQSTKRQSRYSRPSRAKRGSRISASNIIQRTYVATASAMPRKKSSLVYVIPNIGKSIESLHQAEQKARNEHIKTTRDPGHPGLY